MFQRNGSRPIVSAIALLLVSLLLHQLLQRLPSPPPGPGGETRPRVLLIGLDAADWVMLDRWIGDGELPAIAGLAAGGRRGDLRTMRPIISPLVWTSIATGQTPDRHGVTDFFSGSDRQGRLLPVTRAAVRCPTIWDLLSRRGSSIAVVAWWATWPADGSLDGAVVTDRVQFAFPGPVRRSGAATTPALYHPADLEQRLRHCLVSPERLDDRMIRPFAGKASGPPPDLLRNCLAATATYYRMTRQILLDGRPDFTALYVLGTDTVAHLSGGAGDHEAADRALLKFYRLVDAMIGDLCRQAAPGTLVMLVSDHGFYIGEDRPAGDAGDFRRGAAGWHRPLGMVLFNAPWIAPGRLDDAGVLDIAPTLLWQLRGETSEALPGRVLVRERMPGAAPPPHAGPGREPVARRAAAPTDESGNNGSIDEQLRALGYLDPEESNRSVSARPVIHLADYLQWAGKPADALAALEQGRADLGEIPELLTRLAIQRSRTGDHRGAWKALEAALEFGWDPRKAGALASSVGLCCAAGRADRAETLLGAADPADASSQVLTARGVLAEHRGRTGAALDSYASALAADPASRHAAHRLAALLPPGDARLTAITGAVQKAADHQRGNDALQLNAGKLLLADGDTDSAARYLDRAVYLEPDIVEPRQLLGAALYRAGRPAAAFEVLRRGLDWHPDDPRLLSAAGAAAVRAGYRTEGRALLLRAAECGAGGPHLEAALELTDPH